MGIDNSIKNLKERKDGLEKYARIISSLDNGVDVSKDEDFQRTFTGFFKVRIKAEWRQSYYDFFQKKKNKPDLSFEEILWGFSQATGRVEASFSSKMLAVINPKMPIWDSIVLKKLKNQGVKTNNKAANINDRLKKTADIYESIKKWYDRFMNDNDGVAKGWINRFNDKFPDYIHFSDVKKIDFILWASGDTDPFDGKVY